MYKQIISIALAGLIGSSTGIYGAEIAPKAPTDNVQVAETTTAVTDVPVAPVVTITIADDKKVPMLINFDQKLYKNCCEGHQSFFGNQCWNKLQSMVPVAFMVGIGILGLREIGFQNIPSVLSTAWSLFWQASLYKKACNLWQYCQTGSILVAGLFATKTFNKNFENWALWNDRENFMWEDQRKIWHEQIYALFGRPEVVGTFPVTGKYLLKGYKKYGAGQVIFDPFDLEQVKILLGIGRIEEDLRCSKIEFIIL